MNQQEDTMPEKCTEEMLDYLDDLRESGATNMFGATPFLRDAFAITQNEARAILLYWMNTFSERHPR
jgi:hypothetical protein